MSRATSFASVMQQVSLSLGVAIGALILQAGQVIQGEMQVSRGDFAAAFWIVAAIGLLSVISFLRLPKGAGGELAGRPAGTAAAPDALGANPRAEAATPQ
jgi:hypothetical protein